MTLNETGSGNLQLAFQLQFSVTVTLESTLQVTLRGYLEVFRGSLSKAPLSRPSQKCAFSSQNFAETRVAPHRVCPLKLIPKQRLLSGIFEKRAQTQTFESLLHIFRWGLGVFQRELHLRPRSMARASKQHGLRYGLLETPGKPNLFRQWP